MTVINNQLVLVGGGAPDNEVKKVVGVWRPDSKNWIHPYPDMSTRSACCSVAAYKE